MCFLYYFYQLEIYFIFREVSVTLKSIFQPLELEYYVKMSKREKEEQLMELMCIVAGIRLFNRDCQRGGEGIDDCKSLKMIKIIYTIKKKQIVNASYLFSTCHFAKSCKKKSRNYHGIFRKFNVQNIQIHCNYRKNMFCKRITN